MPNDTCPDCGKIIPGKGAVLFGQCLDGLHVCPTTSDARERAMIDETPDNKDSAYMRPWKELADCKARLDRALALLREAEDGRADVNGVCRYCAIAPYIVTGEKRTHAPDCKLKALLEESDD